jgi:ribosomal protein S3AE
MAKKPQKKKFFNVIVPLIEDEYDIQAYLLEELNNRSLKVDMTRRLKGKSLDLVFTIKVDSEKHEAIAVPKKLRVMPFFIRHMLRKRISYVEDSIKTQSKESEILIKPFLITRKKVSRSVRKTLRNASKNWIEDYCKTKTNDELFEEILSGKLQRELSIKLKKVYPLSLCEIRVLEVKESLENPEEPAKKEEEEVKEAKEEAKPKEDKKIPDKKPTSKKQEKPTKDSKEKKE